ncbi:helicase RepA family protein [Marinomonas sp. FW-1]|uniref:AAA family ATPase n=1 Tax=Marinomonas sp. FW-1 TaxID=2071621 RepID=UPI0010BFD9CC|nr:helicase RepA family protein [Marinomonas sp. FW-1]
MSLNAFTKFAAEQDMKPFDTFQGNGDIEPVKGGDAAYFPEAGGGVLIPRQGDPIYFGDIKNIAPLVKAAFEKGTEESNDASHQAPIDNVLSLKPILRKPIAFHPYNSENIKPNNWLIKDYLEVDSLSLIYGAPANGKSFVAIDWAACIATGKDWHGQKVKQGAVFYLAGEGFNGLNKRQAAWERVNGKRLSTAPLYTSNKAAVLTDLTQLQEMMMVIQSMIQETNEKPALLVVDTLARCFGGNENAADDMSRFISNLDTIRAVFGCSVLVVHHSGKDTDKGARGSTALKGAVDTEYSCSLTETDSGKVITIKNSKMKDADTPAHKSFLLEAQKLDITDEDGQPFWAPALIETDYQAPLTPKLAKLGANQQKALDLIQEMVSIAKEHQSGESITTQLNEVREEDFKQRAYQQGITTSKNYSSFIGKLEERRFIKRQAAYIQLLEVP